MWQKNPVVTGFFFMSTQVSTDLVGTVSPTFKGILLESVIIVVLLACWCQSLLCSKAPAICASMYPLCLTLPFRSPQHLVGFLSFLKVYHKRSLLGRNKHREQSGRRWGWEREMVGRALLLAEVFNTPA